MKLHRNLVFATVDALSQIFNDQKQADKVLQQVLKRDKRWGARDRAFIAETTYDIVRWFRLYAEIADIGKGPFDRNALMRLVAVWIVLKGIPLPTWDEFKDTPKRKIKGRFDELSSIRKFRESIPDWLDELGEKELGERWDTELRALNNQAKVVLRVNSLKAAIKDVRSSLEREGIMTETIKGYPQALQLIERANVFTTQAFKDGWFEVQDASSQLVGELLDPKPGMRIVDACAGAGGKTLQLAAMMENKGQLIALDIYDFKLKELKRRAKRNGVHNVETRLIDNNKVVKRLKGKADKVLLDAPCSGLGVLRRNPDAKWKINPDFLKRVQETQSEIIRDYSGMVKPGGELIYVTCSILPSENEHQVNSFLNSEAGNSFSLIKEKKIWPSESGYDGFYMARLRKDKSQDI